MKIRFFTLLAALLLSSFAGAQNYDTNTLTNGLVAWYPLHGNANDYSKLGVNGVCNGGCNPTFDRFGNPSGALVFDGSQTIGASAYNYTRAYNNFTISIWVKPAGNNPDSEESIYSNRSRTGTLMSHPIVLASQWGGADSGIFISVGTNGVSILEHGADFLPVLLNYKKEITDWTQISVVVDNNGPEQLYINGIYIRSSLSTGRAKLASAFAWNFNGANSTEGIGGSMYGKYVGSASDLRIYNRALSSNELAALYAMESMQTAPPSTTDTFGTGTNQFGIDFVTVGNPGNSNDTTGYGGVPYSYRIGKYTISQNQVDAATRNGLQNVSSFERGDQPAWCVSWYEAAAYVNWLNTSQGFRPAYNLNFTNGAWSMALWPTSPDTSGNVAWTLGGTNLFRNALCHYFLPSENEWYKAAFGKNDGTGYYQYATASDLLPVGVASGTNSGTVVINNDWSAGTASVFQAGGLSAYGTMGQTGNCFQWTETTSDGKNNIVDAPRFTGGMGYWYYISGGGYWDNGVNIISSSYFWSTDPSNKVYPYMSFRVASVDDSSDRNNYLFPFVPIDLGSIANTSLASMQLQGGVPISPDYTYGMPARILGVPFNIPRDRNNVWDSKIPTSWGSGTASALISTNVEACSGFYTMIQLFWGYENDNSLSLEFNFSDGTKYIKNLIAGIDVRNYNNRFDDPTAHTINNTSTINVFNGEPHTVLDRQYIDFESAGFGGKNLVSFAIHDNGDVWSQRAFLVAATAVRRVPPPTITTQPFDQAISLGQNTSFTIEATGSGPFSYQWMKDGVALTNQTNASLVITNAQSNAVGYYTCTVTDANSNSLTSSNAALNISGVPFWLWQGLVAYYPFDGNANDKSINHYTAQIFGGVTLASNRFGKPNSCYYFNGIDGYMDIGNPVEKNPSQITQCAWIKLCEYTDFAWSPIMTKRQDNNGCGWPTLAISGTRKHYGLNYSAGRPELILDGCGYGNSEYNAPSINTNTWAFVCGVLNAGGRYEIYLNGVLCGVLNDSYNLQGSDFNMLLMKEWGQPLVNGFLSDVRIYNRALSSNEVASLYALESTPPGPTNSQSISFPAIPTLTLTNGACTLVATASSGLPVSYAIGDTNVATLTNGTLIPLGVGTTTVVASQAGDINYLQATPVTNTLVVTLAQQVVTPTAVATRTYGSLPFGLTLPTNASGLPITARIVSGPATLSGTNLILTGTGTVTLAYDAPGSSVYAAASITNSFAVTNGPTNLKSQTIITKPLGSKTYGSAPFALMGVASSKLPLTYWSSNTNVVVINGTNAVITGAGQAVITAYQPGDGTTYNPATPVSQPLLVNQAAQKLTLKAPKSTAYGSTPVAISATSTAGLPVTLTSSDPTIASITNNGTNSLLVPTGVGTITLTASQAGTANVVAAAPVGLPVVITPGAQTITFAPLTASAYGASPITLSATSSAGLPVTFSSSAAGIASISGNTLTIAGAGGAKITASQAGSKLWAPAKAITQSLAVAKAPQTISLSIPSSVTFTNGGLLPLTGTSSSGLPVAYKSGNAKVLFIQGTNCLISGRGTTTVVATQPGSGNYLAAPAVTNTVTVQ